MVDGGAPRAVHREHVRLWAWTLWAASVVLGACEPSLDSFVGRSQVGADAGTVDGGARRGDAGYDARRSADASASEAVGLDTDASVFDAAVGTFSDAGAREAGAASAFDAQTLRETGPHDAASSSAQGWPLVEAGTTDGTDAGLSVLADGATAVVVDGEISEWPSGIWTELSYHVEFAETARGEFAAVCAWQVVNDALFLAVVVRDDLHHNKHGGFDIWKGDSLQVAFDVGQARLPYDWEYGVAWVNDEVDVHRWLSSDADLGEKFPAAVARWDDLTVYELRFEPARLGLNALGEASVRVSVAVNDSDGYERTRALALAPGIVEPSKSKSEFVALSW